VVNIQEDGLVTDFMNKPNKYIGSIINAGVYLFQTDVLDIKIVRILTISTWHTINLLRARFLLIYVISTAHQIICQ
jgi:NDP-sugar pyrophosphorylase family protein